VVPEIFMGFADQGCREWGLEGLEGLGLLRYI